MREQKTLEKRLPGVEIEWRQLTSGPVIRDAMLAGQMDIGSGGVGAVHPGHRQGPRLEDAGRDERDAALSQLRARRHQEPEGREARGPDRDAGDRLDAARGAPDAGGEGPGRSEEAQPAGRGHGAPRRHRGRSSPSARSPVICPRRPSSTSSSATPASTRSSTAIRRRAARTRSTSSGRARSGRRPIRGSSGPSSSRSRRPPTSSMPNRRRRRACTWRAEKAKSTPEQILEIMKQDGIKCTMTPAGLTRFATYMQKIGMIKGACPRPGATTPSTISTRCPATERRLGRSGRAPVGHRTSPSPIPRSTGSTPRWRTCPSR